MNSIRSRTRPAVGASQATGNAQTTQSSGTWGHSGAEARARAETEIRRQQEAAQRRAAGIGFMPHRFYCPTGTTRDIIVLDQEPAFAVYEHALQRPNSTRYDVFESCPKEFDACPLCQGGSGARGKESYYVLFLTVIDLTPYTSKAGTPDEKEVPWSRKLLPVKARDQSFFFRQHEFRGTLRGMHLLMARDTQESASIGRAEVFAHDPDNSEFRGWHSEEEIMASFGGPAVLDQQGKIIKPANADCFAYEYPLLFPKPSGDDLRRRHGGQPPAGSRAEGNQWGDRGDTPSYTRQPAGQAPASRGITGSTSRQPAATQAQNPEAGIHTSLDDEIPF